MKIIIPGGSGQIGAILTRAFQGDGHDVVVLSRGKTSTNVRSVRWDGVRLGEWASELDGADIVINLAGRTVNCRYNSRNRQEILRSRIASTKVLGEAIANAVNPPKLWLQSGTATIYAHRFDAPNDEGSGVIGGSEPDLPDTWRFSIDVARKWEDTALEADTPKTRKVILRSAMVMSPDAGGPFDVLLGLVRYGLGGKSGSGWQYVSWIHESDFVRAVKFLIEHLEIDGAVNLAAPNPVPNAEFMKSLREAWGIRFGLPAAEWMLEIGAIFLRTETELVLKSRRVIPGRLLEKGFEFDFPNWSDAAKDLCLRWRRQRGRPAS